MKPSPERNFPVTVRAEYHEHPAANPAVFADVYRLILNFTVTVTFMPGIDPDAPLSPDDNFDEPLTAGRAAWTAAYAADCIVARSDALAGTQRRIELLPAPGYEPEPPGDDSIPLVYVSSRDFAIYARELAELADQFSGPRDSKPLSEVAGYQVVAFALANIVNAAHLSSRQLELLGRGGG